MKAMTRKKNNGGELGAALLIELLFVLIISSIILAQAVPAYMRMMAIQQEVQARQQIRAVVQAETQIALCNMTAGCSVPVGVSSVVPLTTVNQFGYVFQITPGACFIYTAVPQSSAKGQRSYYSDCSNVLRYVESPATNPTAASPVWAW
jgi:type II secretory pathway pseudopilin PulG